MIAQPKGYQTEAKNNVLDIFRYANAQIDAATDPDSRRAAIAHNGCVLIQAPTGAGKTLIAGLVAEEFARDPGVKLVWLWFTPFAGLVEQARIAIKTEFNGLRVRDIARERRAHGTRSGDVFVSTWAAVSGRKDSKRLRRDGDETISLDLLLDQWRKDGFKIGVITDHAAEVPEFTDEQIEALRYLWAVSIDDQGIKMIDAIIWGPKYFKSGPAKIHLFDRWS